MEAQNKSVVYLVVLVVLFAALQTVLMVYTSVSQASQHVSGAATGDGELSLCFDRPASVFSIPSQQLVAGSQFQYQVAATHPDGEALTYSATPSWVEITADTGLISFAASNARVGTHQAVVTVRALCAEQSVVFTLQILALPSAGTGSSGGGGGGGGGGGAPAEVAPVVNKPAPVVSQTPVPASNNKGAQAVPVQPEDAGRKTGSPAPEQAPQQSLTQNNQKTTTTVLANTGNAWYQPALQAATSALSFVESRMSFFKNRFVLFLILLPVIIGPLIYFRVRRQSAIKHARNEQQEKSSLEKERRKYW